MMAKSTKVDALLETALEKIADIDPAFLLDLVVTPGTPEDVEPLVQYIQEYGGKLTNVLPEAVNCRMPAGQVRRLAQSNLVRDIRLARLHRMHSSP